MKIRCVVACVDSQGFPSLYPVTVFVSEDGYNEGIHYEEAKSSAEEDGYSVAPHAVVFDENDGPDFLFSNLFQEV